MMSIRFHTLGLDLILLSVLLSLFTLLSSSLHANVILPKKSTISVSSPSQAAPAGGFVLDNVLHWYSNASWSPNKGSGKKGKLTSIALRNEGGRWVRAEALNLKWKQTEKDWILNSNNNNQLRVEFIFHAFRADTNACLNDVTISGAGDWISSDVPGFEVELKSYCEPRAVVTEPTGIDITKKYYYWAWFRDDAPREMGEVPLAIGWQTLNHSNAAPDDNVRKFCFGADEGRAWGPRPDGSGACNDNGAPVYLHNISNFLGTVQEGFTGKDQNLSNNPIGNDSVRSLRIRQGWSVTLYQNNDYGGVSETFISDDNDLSNNSIGYGASSVEVNNNGVWVYRDYPYTGVSEYFAGYVACDNDLSNNTIGNNQITSVRVPPGWRVTLYDGFNCTGNKHVIQGVDDHFPNFGTGNFNDRTSSIRVMNPDSQLSQGELGDWTLDE